MLISSLRWGHFCIPRREESIIHKKIRNLIGRKKRGRTSFQDVKWTKKKRIRKSSSRGKEADAALSDRPRLSCRSGDILPVEFMGRRGKKKPPLKETEFLRKTQRSQGREGGREAHQRWTSVSLKRGPRASIAEAPGPPPPSTWTAEASPMFMARPEKSSTGRMEDSSVPPPCSASKMLLLSLNPTPPSGLLYSLLQSALPHTSIHPSIYTYIHIYTWPRLWPTLLLCFATTEIVANGIEIKYYKFSLCILI